MWPWQQRSKFAKLHLPRKVFISHSYKDADVRERLLRVLPKGVEPFIFPPIVVAPEQMVSNNLIDAILDCGGLVYIDKGYSAESFWVAFERDYALRVGKPVFRFDPTSGVFSRDVEKPLSLPVFLSHSHRDDEKVFRIYSIMKDQRYFDTWLDRSPTFSDAETFVIMARMPMSFRLAEGGYVVMFWSKRAFESLEIAGSWIRADLRMVAEDYRHRILVARLDETPLPHEIEDLGSLQLFGDPERSETQRIDHLIVRLYWLIYRNSRQNQLD